MGLSYWSGEPTADTISTDVDGMTRYTFPCFVFHDYRVSVWSGMSTRYVPEGAGFTMRSTPVSPREWSEYTKEDQTWCQCSNCLEERWAIQQWEAEDVDEE